MKPVIYHPEASAEFDAAVERYESLSVGLGESFVDEVEAIVARIEESPAQFPVWQGNPRYRTCNRQAVQVMTPFRSRAAQPA